MTRRRYKPRDITLSIRTGSLGKHPFPLSSKAQKLTSQFSGGRLNKHGHNNPNTHKVLFGGMKIVRPDSEAKYIQAASAGSSVPVAQDVCYIGVAGDKGCLFVEGHKLLSPTTAARFADRGTIVKCCEDDAGAMETTDQVKIDCEHGIHGDALEVEFERMVVGKPPKKRGPRAEAATVVEEPNESSSNNTQ